MKKTILAFIFCICIYMIAGNTIDRKVNIPDEAIRMRVIANSNSEYDQTIKMKVSYSLQNKLSKLLKNSKSIDEARKIIRNSLNTIDQSIVNTLTNENYKLGYSINYGDNYFPEKLYEGIIYEQGMYESLLVTLGEGNGDNWWCVMFPPLCMMEFDEKKEIEYTSIIKEIIKNDL